MNKEEILKLLKKEWHIQGFIATPLYIVPCGNSGITMSKHYGADYEYFIYFFKKDYCEMYYSANGLKKVWFELEKRYKKDKECFNKIRQEYRTIMAGYDDFKKDIDTLKLEDVPEDKFIDMFRRMLDMAKDSAEIAHVCEAFSMLNDVKLRHKLKEMIDDPGKVNSCFKTLSEPITSSRITDNEVELCRISKIPDKEEREKALEKHAAEFFWVRNNYLYATPLAVEDFREQIESVTEFKTLDYEQIKKDKAALIKELELDDDTVELIHHIEFFVDFQDERKREILIAMSYMQKMAHELARRYGIKHVKYLVREDITKEFLSSDDVNKILDERWKGVLIVADKDGNHVITGKVLEEIEKGMSAQHENGADAIHGMTASSGTAVGYAVVVKTQEALQKVKEGDILIAPMTRPEFVPAMKKAAAIVTDEGGITCHAAIVSRELGIPCVIGTKTATKVIQTGDLVEVKGNHGLVSILERKELL
jgi:phosphohistidine swiveling domain-containing protein